MNIFGPDVEINKVLVLSSAHICYETSLILAKSSDLSNELERVLHWDLHELGWRLKLSTLLDDPECATKKVNSIMLISPDLVPLIVFAISQDCKVIDIDVDGPNVNFLPTYVW